VSAACSDPLSNNNAKHLAAVARSLQWADEAAAADHADALAWLQTVEATGDTLPDAYEAKRRAWRLAVNANRPER